MFGVVIVVVQCCMFSVERREEERRSVRIIILSRFVVRLLEEKEFGFGFGSDTC